MGEYIKHKKFETDNEIKIAVCRGDVEAWESNYPLNMLKEFSYLGFDDWYAGSFEESKEGISFLDKLINNYDKIAKTWANDRKFSEIIPKDNSALEFVNNHVERYDIIKLHKNGYLMFVISNYYIEDMKLSASKMNTKIDFIPYEFQHVGKLATYNFSELQDNGAQKYYHVDCGKKDSIDVLRNNGDASKLWYIIYHNSSGGEEVLNYPSDNMDSNPNIIGNQKCTIYTFKSAMDAKRFACDWYNSK